MATGTRTSMTRAPNRHSQAIAPVRSLTASRAMQPETQARMESRFGWNFADVRVRAKSEDAAGIDSALRALGRASRPDLARNLLRDSFGKPLEAGTRAEMEQKFGADFASVRVHTDRWGALAAAMLGADAWTAGHDIAFGEGRFAPGSQGGKMLLAHELAHVVQQGRGGPTPRPFDRASAAEHDAGRAARQASGVGPVVVTVGTAPGLARQESAEPWWKQRLNPIYRRALEVLPKAAAGKLEQANEVARQLVAETGASDSHLNQLVKAAEPVIEPVAGYLNLKSNAPPPQKAADAPTVWLGEPPIDTQIEQRHAQQAAQAQLDRTQPGALAPPIQKPTVSDLPPLNVLLRPDPPPTAFEISLKEGKPFTIKVHPKPDIDPAKAYWLGRRPTDAQLRNRQFEDAEGRSRGIWVDDGKLVDLDVHPDATMAIRDPSSHELKGYRVRNSDTMTILNRSGELVGSRNLEAPLEHPAIDPIDIAMLGADLGPLVAKGVTAGGKALVEGAAKYGLREAGKAATDDLASISGREAADALESGLSHPREFPEIELGAGPANDVKPLEAADALTANSVLSDEQNISTQVITEQTLKPASADEFKIAAGQDFAVDRTTASAGGAWPARRFPGRSPPLRSAAGSARGSAGVGSRGPTVVRFGRDEVHVLDAMWRERLAQTTDAAERREIRSFLKSLKSRTRPLGRGRQSEGEITHFFRLDGGKGQVQFNVGGPRGATRLTIPDVDAPNVRVEIKNWEMIHISSESMAEHMLQGLEKQVAARRLISPFKPQNIILDVRGQTLTPDQIQRIGKTFAQRTGLSERQIWIVTW